MDEFKTTVIKAFDIPDAWFKAIERVLGEGHVWKIQRGSKVGHERLEFDNVLITIKRPYTLPLIPSVPDGVPPPTSHKELNEYLGILLTPDKGSYQYNYGERIYPQIKGAIKMLRETPMTNQCTIEVGQPSDMKMEHPPCLRLIDFRVRYGALHMFVYFRSWDLYAGLPSNLGGLQLFSQYIANETDLEYGTLNAWSKGLHLYDYQWEFARKLVGGKMAHKEVKP